MKGGKPLAGFTYAGGTYASYAMFSSTGVCTTSQKATSVKSSVEASVSGLAAGVIVRAVAGLKAGETVLIPAASSSVGIAAIQWLPAWELFNVSGHPPEDARVVRDDDESMFPKLFEVLLDDLARTGNGEIDGFLT